MTPPKKARGRAGKVRRVGDANRTKYARKTSEQRTPKQLRADALSVIAKVLEPGADLTWFEDALSLYDQFRTLYQAVPAKRAPKPLSREHAVALEAHARTLEVIAMELGAGASADQLRAQLRELRSWLYARQPKLPGPKDRDVRDRLLVTETIADRLRAHGIEEDRATRVGTKAAELGALAAGYKQVAPDAVRQARAADKRKLEEMLGPTGPA